MIHTIATPIFHTAKTLLRFWTYELLEAKIINPFSAIWINKSHMSVIRVMNNVVTRTGPGGHVHG